MFSRTTPETPAAIRRTALDLLARREHSYAEMLRKLRQRGADVSMVEVELEQLQQDGLLCDERFCEAYVHYRSQRGYGPQRLREELRQRGVAESLIEQELRSGERDWSDLARAAFAKRFPEGPASDIKERARQQRFMQYRGFAGVFQD